MKTKFAHKKEHNSRCVQAGDKFFEQKTRLSPRPAPTLKSILVPIDFSDCSLSALDYASLLARKFQAKLVLLHVVEPAVYPENYLMNPATLDEANRNLIASSRERLARLRHRTADPGLVTETLVRMGRAQSDISDTANATGADLIVMGAHGSSGLKNVVLGGTAERVLRHSPCPVLTVRHP
jgi:nucleotide-binding universal stress UspA family protein